MRLLMTDDDGAIMQEYSGVAAQIDGHEITGTVLMVRIPGEGEPYSEGDYLARKLAAGMNETEGIPGFDY